MTSTILSTIEELRHRKGESKEHPEFRIDEASRSTPSISNSQDGNFDIVNEQHFINIEEMNRVQALFTKYL